MYTVKSQRREGNPHMRQKEILVSFILGVCSLWAVFQTCDEMNFFSTHTRSYNIYRCGRGENVIPHFFPFDRISPVLSHYKNLMFKDSQKAPFNTFFHSNFASLAEAISLIWTI